MCLMDPSGMLVPHAIDTQSCSNRQVGQLCTYDAYLRDSLDAIGPLCEWLAFPLKGSRRN